MTRQKTLGRLEALNDTLSILADSCQRRLRTFKSQSLSAQDFPTGFTDLPDEILARIFKTSLEDHTKDYENHVLVASKLLDLVKIEPGPETLLSQVCQRFRRVALDLPELWAHVSNEY